MTKSSFAPLRRWVKRLVYLASFSGCLLLVAWIAMIILTERAAPFSGAPLPTSVSIADQRYLPAIEKARAHSQAMMAERQIPGLAVAVAVDGKMVWSEGFGYADRDKKVPACPTTQFRVGSVSKLFTAAAMARLYEQGRLDLDAPIQAYVPSFPYKGHPITARQLASHRSGIRHYRDDYEAVNTKHYHSATESLAEFKDDPLMFVPDTGYGYSSYGYVLLSAAIEGVSGEDFPSYMRRHVFEPLGMRHTTEERANEPTPNQSCFYDNVTPYSWDGKVVASPYIDFSSKWAAGGFLSTAEDLVRFGSAHMVPVNKEACSASHASDPLRGSARNGFLKSETLELMFTPRSRKAVILGHGLGWMIMRDLHLRRMYFHFGAGSGGTAVLFLYPEQGVSVAIVANLGHAKFPYERFMGVTNPFLSDPAKYVIAMFVTCLLAGCTIVVRRLLRRPRTIPA